ncbi:PH domain-containing protein [Candidatus Saccharibacteria bacterium]|nr:PH domain-containing protein [Candidatus Saccharibacteria bacterium]
MKTIKPAAQLQDGEEVKVIIQRSKVSLVAVWAVETAIIILLALAIAAMLLNDSSDNNMRAFLPLLIFLIPITVGIGIIQTRLNFKNRMFITNRRVIYERVENLLSRKTKIIELHKIESKKVVKEGVLPHVLGYGTLKLATKSDETTYAFPYCDLPKSKLDLIGELIAATAVLVRSQPPAHSHPSAPHSTSRYCPAGPPA